MDLGSAARARLVSTSKIGAFSWRWPVGIENYERGWAAIADMDGTEFHIRHGIGQRYAFGRTRLRSITWVEGEPLVEGAEADDFDQSQSLLSLIKFTKTHLRPGDEVPPEYASFHVVVFADEIAGANAFRSLAVKVRCDDIETWARHALLRAVA